MPKQDTIEYIYNLLDEYSCNGLKILDNEIRCRCPYHGGKNLSSFRVNFKKADPFFNCFSCHSFGTLNELVAFLTGKSLKRATKLLTKHTDFAACDVSSLVKKYEKAKQSVAEYKAVDIELPPVADIQDPMYDYLEKRRRVTMHKVFKVEYVVNTYGLYYCCEGRMAGRIIMPLYLDGELISFNDRTIVQGISNKSLHQKGVDFDRLVYGLGQAIGKPKCIIVEGGFDMWQVVCALMNDKDLFNTYGSVSLMRSLLSDEQAAIIAENFDEAIIFFDHDKAGIDGAKKAYPKLLEYMPTRDVTKQIMRDKDPGNCTRRQILKAVTSKGYQPKSFIDRLKSWR